MVFVRFPRNYSGMGPVDVWLAHHGTSFAFESAAALQRTGFSSRFLTSIYFHENSKLVKLVRRLPVGLRERLLGELRRRHHPAINPRFVDTFIIPEVLYLLCVRTELMGRLATQLMWWRNHRFDRHVASRVLSDKPRALIAYDTAALDSFRAAKRVGTLCILYQAIGHLRAGLQILREEAQLHPQFARIQQPYPQRIIDRCIQEALEADHVLAPSAYVRDTMVDNGVSLARISILPFGVDTERFHPREQPKGGPFRVLFVGAIGPRKGVIYLIEAFRQLRLPDADLVLAGNFAGDGGWLAPYRAVFRHIPHVPFHEVHEVFRTASIYVFPSLYEGSSNTNYEAMASGLPVITTYNAGSVVRDGVDGYIVPIRDVDALKEKIRLLYENADLRRELGRNARNRAKEFTWEHYTTRLSDILSRVLGKG